MVDILVSIPGALFLLCYSAFAAALIALAHLYLNADGSLETAPPSPEALDALSLAYLAGGRNGALKTVAFDLWNRGMLQITTGMGGTTRIQRSGPSPQGRSPLETELLSYAYGPRSPRDFFRDPMVLRAADPHLQTVASGLQARRLARTPEEKTRASLVSLLVVFLILGAGGAKLLLGLMRAKPVGFLVGLLLVLPIVAVAVLRPWAVTTRLGQRHLAGLRDHFGWVKSSLKVTRHPSGFDPAFAFALFGPSVLAAGDLYAPFQTAFGRNNQSIGGCGGGCGGAGCGGGGGCGGGCGGCGG